VGTVDGDGDGGVGPGRDAGEIVTRDMVEVNRP
jgi:hypothetical protein